ncbi:MAG: ATP-dependent helicase HrpB [Kiritimatiellae bacterium]|nr:ATP-dependent helicase HrpB [Kiritimatiellia bacterium]
MFPVEDILDDVKRALAANREVVLTAPPGSGKTTCVAPALLGEPWLAGKKIVMLEPRRLAARNCAEFIARRLGEDVGGTVGYHVRLERMVSASTRLEIVTEGLLAQRLLSDMELKDAGLVVFDEFHERSLACDLSFALALEVRRALRPDLRIMVMSATLDAGEVAAHLGNAETIRAGGRMYPVETVYLGDVPVVAAIARALRETDGDILCFLPGEGEIRRVNEAYPEALPLYGSLPREEQDRVFREGGGRKIVLATSIAETSLTVPGVVCVIDSGLMRVPRFSPATGMSGLVTLPLSLDRAEQRRGRAGRVRPGVCYRLWSEASEASRPKKMTPEILDSDLAPLALASLAWGATRRDDLPWMTPPGASAWERAISLLKSLGAADSGGRITEKGARMAKLPMHPRLANMILGGGDPVLAAIIEEGARTRETDIRRVPADARIRRLSRRFAVGAPKAMGEGAMLALAYPDRIAKNRGNATFRMVSGRGAYLDREDPLASSPYLVCCKLDDREGDAKIFLACPIGEDEIEDMFADEIVRETVCEWDSRAECVKCAIRRRLGAMTLDERPCRPSGSEERIAAALLDGIRSKGVENLPCWTKETRQLRARVDFLSARCGWPKIDDAEIIEALAGFVGGMSRWRDLEKIDLSAVYGYMLSERGYDRRELDRLAPAKMQVPSGSNMTIHYEGAEPTVEVRLQVCFGLMKTPKVAGGTVPVVRTLLSPAQRPVQVTKDLEGFWKGAYQIVRKDMRGRYPKHYWPEDPFSAVATRRVRPK